MNQLFYNMGGGIVHQIRREKTDNNIRSDCSRSLLFRCFSLFLSHLRTLAQGKRSENCVRFRTGGLSLCLYPLLSRNILFFPALTMAARAKKKFLAKRFAHAISVHYRDFENAYVCWIWLRGSASYVINRFDPWLRFCNICTREAWGLPIPRNSRGFWKQGRWRRKSLSCRGLQRFVMTT